MTWDDDLARRAYEHDVVRWSIWPELRQFLHEWQIFLTHYWGLADSKCPDGLTYPQWETVRTLHQLAPPLLECARGLSVPPLEGASEELKLVRHSLRAHAKHPLTRQVLELHFAEDVLERLQGAGERAARLLGQVQTENSNPEAAAYLRRATELYLSGFEPEALDQLFPTGAAA